MANLNTIHALSYFNLLKTSSWVEDKIKQALKPVGITHAQLNVLYILHQEYPYPVSAYELKDRMLVNNPDLTRLLNRLENKKYISRKICKANRRKIDISLSLNGKKEFENAHSLAKQAVGNFFEDKITAKEAKELRRILHKIRK